MTEGKTEGTLVTEISDMGLNRKLKDWLDCTDGRAQVREILT